MWPAGRARPTRGAAARARRRIERCSTGSARPRPRPTGQPRRRRSRRPAGRRCHLDHDLAGHQGRRRPDRPAVRPGPPRVLDLRPAGRRVHDRERRRRGGPDELPRHRRDEVHRIHADPGQRNPPRPDPRPGDDRRDRRRRRRRPGEPTDPCRHRESFGLPAVSTISIPVILVVILGAVATAALAAIVPSSGQAGSAPSRRSLTGEPPGQRPERPGDEESA